MENMPNKMKSYNDFEVRLKSEQIDSPLNLEKKILVQQKHLKPLYLRTSFIAILLSLFVTASAATAMQFTGWKLFNGEEEQVYEIVPMEEDQHTDDYNYYSSKYRGMLDNKRKHIPEGKFVTFLPVDGYEDLGMTMMSWFSRGKEIKSVAELSGSLYDSLNLVDEGLLGKFNLVSGEVYYEYPEFDAEVVAKELYEEAIAQDKKFIYREEDLTDKIESIQLTYKAGLEKGYMVHMRPTGKKMWTTEDLSSYTKITYRGIDFLYNSTYKMLYAVKIDSSSNILLHISAYTKENEEFNPEEEMIPLAYEILNN